MEFIKDQYRHGKTIFAGAASAQLLAKAGIAPKLPSGKPDPGVIVSTPALLEDQVSKFIAAIGKHRHAGRDQDPPAV
jgi:catalase